jgi:hypothetical protein
MSTRHEDNDGSDIFWPGYVDATTNLILNLLFLLTILIVAVFMFALELGRSSPVETGKKLEASGKQDTEVVFKATTDPVEENIALKREIQRLNMMLAHQVSQNAQSGGKEKAVDATSIVPKPQSGLDKTLATDFEIMVRFKDGAVTFTPAEHDRLLELLKPALEGKKTSIYVEVPAGFSEAKRLGFYRAMAVRNLLIEMNLSGENIDVSVAEGKNSANASLVRVRSR